MKTIEVYEFADLDKDVQDKVLNRMVEAEVELQLELLSEEFNRGELTEEQYYKSLGCSKNYAESTSWFVPSCYYDAHKDAIEEQAKENVEDGLYLEDGSFIKGK